MLGRARVAVLACALAATGSALATTGCASAGNAAMGVAVAAGAARAPYAVGVRVLTFVDHSRTIRLPDGHTVPRTLVTVVRYPTTGPRSRVNVRNAPIVAGHSVGYRTPQRRSGGNL